MDISKGYHLDEPNVLVPWSATWSGLKDLLVGRAEANFYEHNSGTLRRLAQLRCRSLGNLSHDIVITFHDDVLYSFELRFPEGSSDPQGAFDLAKSFPVFQAHLESEFGRPVVLRAAVPESSFAEERFPECEWRLDGVLIRHAIDEHWGPVEHLTIHNLNS